MTVSARRYIADLDLANPLYAGATVSVFQVDPATLVITATLAPLYTDLTSTTQVANPQQLDGEGKWLQPVYIDRPCVIQVGGGLATTGVQGPSGLFRGTWATSIGYVVGDTITDGAAGSNTQSVYYCATPHTSVAFPSDLASGKWLLYVDVTALGLSVAATLTAANTAVTVANTANAAATAAVTTAAASATAASVSAGGASASATAAAASAVTAASFVFARNVIINGAMDLWERGSPLSPPHGVLTYLADRWAAFFDGTGMTVTAQQAPVTVQSLQDSGFSNYMSYVVSVPGSGGTTHQLIQRIEFVRTFAGESVTLSFWAWADSARTIGALFTQIFGTGGSPSGLVSTSLQAFTLSTTPTRFTGTFTIPTVHGKTLGTNHDDCLQLLFSLPVNTACTINVTGVQVQPGPSASSFDWRPVQTELALCQRYYQIGQIASAGYAVSSTTVQASAPFIVMPRTTPIITLGAAFNANVSSPFFTANPQIVAYEGTVTATGGYVLNASFTANAEL